MVYFALYDKTLGIFDFNDHNNKLVICCLLLHTIEEIVTMLLLFHLPKDSLR